MNASGANIYMAMGSVDIEKDVTVMIADVIQGEKVIIEDFIDSGILKKEDIKI